MGQIDQDEIDKRFDHHPPDEAKQRVHEGLRQHYKELAAGLTSLPESREKSLAFTSLEESLMWANASIARNPLKED